MRNFNIHALIIIFALITIPTLAQKAPSWSWPQCRNYNGSSPEQPATIYLGDQGTFGHDSWADVDTKWPKWCVVISKNTDLTTGALSGSWSSYSNVQHKTNTSPRFTSTGTWYWGMKVEYTDAGGTTGWYCNNNTTWANMYGSPTSNLTITVTALSDPSSQTAVASSNTQINLSWTKWNDKNVMIVRRLTSAAPSNAPTQGTAYSPGSTLGTGTVVYNSNGTSFNNTGLTPGTDYTYVFYSENYSYYSNGATSSATTTAVSSSSDYFRSKQTGGWNTASNWESSDNGSSNWITGTLVPGSSAASITIQNGHNITLDANVTVSGLTINLGAIFTASDGTARVLTITKSASGSGTTLNNSGTWANGSGGSTVVFTGAPSSGDAIHAISGTVAFQNVTINKTGGSSNVGASFGANSSVSGTLEIGSGGFVSTAPPTSFYGSSAILKFNQGSGATYNVGSGDFSWSTTVIPNFITISSGTVSLNAARTASGNLLIDGGILTLNAGLTIQGNWTRTSGTFTPNSQIVTLSGTTNTIINTATDANLYDLVVSKTSGAYVTMDNNLTVSHNLTISSGAILKVPSGKYLTVSGTLTNNAGTSGLVVESGGSLKQSTADVDATVKRSITAVSDWATDKTGGWHFISSPIVSQAINTDGGFVTSGVSNDYDFYAWSETNNLWVNFKNSSVAPTFTTVNGSSNFVVGRGYMAAYEQSGTKQFTGKLNVSDVAISGMNITSGTAVRSWHLLGNPFTCALTWDESALWARSSVGTACQVFQNILNFICVFCLSYVGVTISC
jgi:hypothetical protein